MTTIKTNNILITGGEHIERLNYAKNLAMKLLCQNQREENACLLCVNCLRTLSNTHPNLQFIEPNHGETSSDQCISDTTGTIKLEQVRRIIIENQKANFENGLSIVIITHIHKTTKTAANALLKVLEENKKDNIFLALAPTRMAVLPTIASRLVCHLMKPSTTTLLSYSEEKRTKIMEISTTAPRKRFPICGQFSTDRDELFLQIDELANTCHALLRNKLIFPHLALALSLAFAKAEKNLTKNLNPRLVVEILILREWPFIDLF